MATTKPNVLILGGLNVCAKSLATFLVPVEGEALVNHLRVVDKFSAQPPTTYLGAEFPKILDKPNVEYRQMNLLMADRVAEAFTPPEGQAPYDYVFDMTGETRHDRPDEFHIKHTLNVALTVGTEAAKRGVKAYVRLTHPFYTVPEKGAHDEKEDLKPEDTTGVWWHESLRALAAIPNLNLVILRIGFVYGPYLDFGQISILIQVTAVYGYMKEPMKALHSPGKHAVHTVHIDDVNAALWAAAGWIATQGRIAADAAAGESIPFQNDKKKLVDAQGVLAPEKVPIAPLFNLVDDGETTWVKAGQTATSVFGTSFEFFNFITNTMAKFKLEDQVEDINDAHVGAWNDMLKHSNPKVSSTTPLNAYMDLYDLQKHTVALNNSKIKRVLGLQLKRPKFDEEAIREVVEKWKAERVWPTV